MQEYWRWQSPERPGQFSYCQYPFMLSIVAKRIILTKVNFHSSIHPSSQPPLFFHYFSLLLLFPLDLGCRASDDIGCEEIPCRQGCEASNSTD
jgi:hypothetical protein